MSTQTIHVPKAQQGFTLLELIVAVSILALIAVFAWRGLDAIVQTRDSLHLSQNRIDDLQRGFNRIERDTLLAQDIRRVDSGMRLLADNGAIVEYRLQGTSLWRRVINTGNGSVDEEQRLFDDVASWNLDVFHRTPDGAASWMAVPSEVTVTQGPVPNPAPAASATNPNVSTLPATRFAVPTFPGNPAQSTTTPNPAFNPSATDSPLRQNSISGLRMMMKLTQGGQVQRIFLLGSGA